MATVPATKAQHEALRPALERAFAVAREGLREQPPVLPPSVLEPLLRFTRLPRRALAAVRSAVEEDDEFRERVVAAATPDDVGPLAWAWLTRTDGWEAQLDEVLRSSDLEQTREALVRAEAEAERRLQDAAEALARAQAAQQTAEQALAGVQRDLADERRRGEDLAREARRLEDEREALARRVGSAEERANRAEGSLGRERGRARDLSRQVEELAAELAAARAAPAAAEPVPEAPVAAPTEPAARDAGGSVGGIDREALSAVVNAAAEAAARLAIALEQAAELVGPDDDRAEEPESWTPRRPAKPRVTPRRALRLPRAILEEDPEAAEYLFGVEDVLVLVDGYNVTLRRWADLPLPTQRNRLVALLSGWCGRTPASFHIVFDGAETVEPVIGLPPRCPVAVTFTSADVEADDQILEMVDAAPPDRPVVVVSSDNRVRDGARQRGANVVGSDQLLELIA